MRTKILTSLKPDSLTKGIEELIADGWKMSGDVFTTGQMNHQYNILMVKGDYRSVAKKKKEQ